METYRDVRQADLVSPTVVTIGNFDGLHRGHQALLRRLQEVADEIGTRRGEGVETALITFEPHPIAVLRPEHLHRLLTTARERLALAALMGVDIGVIQPFTASTAQTSHVEFVTWLRRHLRMAALVVGPDFALGRHRAGTVEVLAALGRSLHFEVVVMEAITLDGGPVRSSQIRDLLRAGSVDLAADLLGRPYRVTGLVKEGDQRGRTVGIPTANLYAPEEKLLPADGVYATRTLLATFDRVHVFESVTNVGVRPTVDGLHHRVETHILDFPPPGQIDDLYGETIAVDFLYRLRGEKKFGSVDELVTQIQHDITQARAWFNSNKQW